MSTTFRCCATSCVISVFGQMSCHDDMLPTLQLSVQHNESFSQTKFIIHSKGVFMAKNGLSDFPTLILGVRHCLCWLPSIAKTLWMTSWALCKISSHPENVWMKKSVQGKGEGCATNNMCENAQDGIGASCLMKDWLRRWVVWGQFEGKSVQLRGCGWEGGVS